MTYSKAIKLILLVLTFGVLQRSQFGTVTISGIHPDFLIAATVVFGLIEGREAGAVAGFVFGLMADSFTTVPFGVSSLVYASMGYLAGMLEVTSLPESRVVDVVVGAACAGGGEVFLYGVLQVLGLHSILEQRLVSAVVVQLAMGAFFALLIAPLLKRLLRIGAEERPPSRRAF